MEGAPQKWGAFFFAHSQMRVSLNSIMALLRIPSSLAASPAPTPSRAEH